MENYQNPHDKHSEINHTNDAGAFWIALAVITLIGVLMIYLGMR